MDPRPNVLLVVLDTVRAQNCSVCGYARSTTPCLDTLAAEGARYVNAVATAPWTLPAHVSLFTGRYCFQHQVDGRRYKLGVNQPVLGEILQAEGYATAGISSNVWISEPFGFHRGFEYFHKTWLLFQSEVESAEMVKLDPGAVEGRAVKAASVLRTSNPALIVNALYAKLLAKRQDGGSAAVSRRAIQWLRPRRKRPFFLFLNYIDPHAPYLAPPRYRHVYASANLSAAQTRRLAALSRRSRDYHMGRLAISQEDFGHLGDLYDEEIRYTDARLAQVMEHLRRTGELDDTLVIVVADHGENIGNHGLMAHRFSLHQTLLHVPFVVRYPRALAAGIVEPAYVQLTDVLPTVLSAIGRQDLIGDLKLDGANLLGDALDRDRPALAEYLSTDYTAEARAQDYDFESSPYSRTLRAFYQGNWKLIESQVDEQHELYDLSLDPLEKCNVALEQPETLTGIRRSLQEFLEIRSSPEREVQQEELAVDRRVEERLKALGYLG